MSDLATPERLRERAKAWRRREPQSMSSIPDQLDAAADRIEALEQRLASAETATDEFTIPNLVAFVQRLSRKLRQHDPNSKAATQALDFIERKSLCGSILRDADWHPEPGEEKCGSNPEPKALDFELAATVCADLLESAGAVILQRGTIAIKEDGHPFIDNWTLGGNYKVTPEQLIESAVFALREQGWRPLAESVFYVGTRARMAQHARTMTALLSVIPAHVYESTVYVDDRPQCTLAYRLGEVVRLDARACPDCGKPVTP